MENKQISELNMDTTSRTQHSARNTTIAMLARVLSIALGFCTRIVFTHTLSEAYVGVNGLFTNILNVLSLTDLGISTAIIYGLYKPIAQKDYEKQKSLLQMYKYFYRFFAICVMGIGLLLIPFMDVLIKTKPEGENLVLLYLIYLVNCAMSYLLVYKKMLVDAHQLSHIGVIYQTVFLVIQNVLQITVLLTTKNFMVFVLMMLLCTILNNLCISAKADKLFPYLKERKVEPLSGEEKQEMYQTIRAMLMHKLGNVVVNNTANLLLSAMVGIVSVGIYSNYYLVIGSIRQVLNQMFQGITASVGNLSVEESKERVLRIFQAVFFICQWLFGFATICLYELLTPFVELSFGAQYVFEKGITLVLCLGFYFTGMRQATLVFKDSFGQFQYDKYKAVIEVLINLGVSIVLGYYCGAIGIFAGMIISTLTTSFWFEPYMLYKYSLQTKVSPYFGRYAGYVAVTAGVWYVTDLLCELVQGSVLLQLIGRFGICMIVPNLLFLICYVKSGEFSFLWEKLLRLRGMK